MSTINPNQPTYPIQPSALEKSASTSQAQDQQGDLTLKKLKTLLTPANIKHLLEHPDAAESREFLAELRPLMTPANISSMLRGPHAEARAKVLEEISILLNKDKLETGQNALFKGLEKDFMQRASLRNLELLTKAFDGGLEDIYGFLGTSNEALGNLRQRIADTKSANKELSGFGGMLSKEKIDGVRREHKRVER
ncbi:hypothetical protein [Pseudomonas reactans]|uniref:hypothetical protein n=1 Tax=Pseudomonas reactans TaxID=117680 RepID=UPI0015A35662|nr:hypothetical protein [Pseudomonas reactans]NWA70062.1 hypothetical protein [Pseudomonas reactans]